MTEKRVRIMIPESVARSLFNLLHDQTLEMNLNILSNEASGHYIDVEDIQYEYENLRIVLGLLKLEGIEEKIN